MTEETSTVPPKRHTSVPWDTWTDLLGEAETLTGMTAPEIAQKLGVSASSLSTTPSREGKAISGSLGAGLELLIENAKLKAKPDEELVMLKVPVSRLEDFRRACAFLNIEYS